MRDSSLRCHEALFRLLLRTYAPELRAEFGEEIVEVFRQHLLNTVDSRGAAGLFEVWTCALGELPVVVLDGVPWQFVVGVAISTLIAFLTFWCVIAGTGVAKIGVM